MHDWLTGMRGGERVLEQVCLLFPEATLFTLFHAPGSVSPTIGSMPIRSSVLNRLPGIERYYRYLLPLYPAAAWSLDLRGFDLVLSSSHAAAKGVRIPAGAIHVCYCHTPMRYVWDGQSDYFCYGEARRLKKAALSAAAPLMRAWDRRTARRVDHFIANSRNVKDRITRCYGRPAQVLYPPVDTTFFTPSSNGDAPSHHLVVSALVPYKRIDIAVEAFNRLGLPLVIVGTGPDLEALRRKAAPNILFKGRVSDEELRSLYRRSRSLIVPGQEDFGLAAVESLACGRPVVAFAAGGSLESVRDGETGVLFEPQTSRALEEAVRRLDRLEFDPASARIRAERHANEEFRRELKRMLDEWIPLRCVPAPAAAGGADAAPEVLPVPGAADSHRLGGSSAVHASTVGLRGSAKRCLDVMVSALLLALMGPALIALAWRIKRETPGPGFIRQTRLGLRGREFLMFKLRTMHENAEREGRPVWAVNRDPRCTPTGNLLRRFGFDELPQLWNVLKGDMSLVGPRPERPEFHREFVRRISGFERRLEAHGGITGLAQIRGWRGDTSVEERLRSDLEYLDHWSFRGDLRILLRTLPEILRRPRPGSGP